MFRSKYKYILYSSTMYVYCVYSTMSKSPIIKQVPNCLKRVERGVVLMVFGGVLYQVRA